MPPVLAEQTLLVHSGAFAKYVGRLDLVVRVGANNADPENRSRIVSFAYKNIPVDSPIPEDAEIANLMWPYSVKLNQDIDLNGVFAWVAPSGETKILRNDQGGGDSQLGNLVARAMQVQPGVDAEFSITNSLGIRADFERGALTNEQLFNVFPFENSITVMYLSGQEVQDTLDFVARKSASRVCRTQAQVSGIAFDMVCKGDCPSLDPLTGEKATACAKNISTFSNFILRLLQKRVWRPGNVRRSCLRERLLERGVTVIRSMTGTVGVMSGALRVISPSRCGR